MSVSFADDYFTNSSHCCDHMARFDRKNFIAITMKQEKWLTAQTGRHFASSRLCGKGDHTCYLVHDNADAHGDCTTKRVSHHHDSLSTGIGYQLHSCRHVETTGIEIVRSAIRHANHGYTAFRPGFSEVLIQTFTRTEQAAHRTTTRHNGRWLCRLTCWYLMPQQ